MYFVHFLDVVLSFYLFICDISIGIKCPYLNANKLLITVVRTSFFDKNWYENDINVIWHAEYFSSVRCKIFQLVLKQKKIYQCSTI